MGGLADDDARAVIHEEEAPDGRPGMDVDARALVGVLAHEAGQEDGPFLQQPMGETMDGEGEEARIAEDDLVEALRRRIAVEGGLHVLGQKPAQLGQGVDEARRDPLRELAAVPAVLALPPAAVAEAAVELAAEILVDVVQLRAHVEANAVPIRIGRAEVTGKEHLEEILDEPDGLRPGRPELVAEMLEPSLPRGVGLEERLGGPGDAVLVSETMEHGVGLPFTITGMIPARPPSGKGNSESGRGEAPSSKERRASRPEVPDLSRPAGAEAREDLACPFKLALRPIADIL